MTTRPIPEALRGTGEGNAVAASDVYDALAALGYTDGDFPADAIDGDVEGSLGVLDLIRPDGVAISIRVETR